MLKLKTILDLYDDGRIDSIERATEYMIIANTINTCYCNDEIDREVPHEEASGCGGS
ncbi:MAG: hypothetical protein ACOX7P_02850 [Oscillospiraceae bacterium]